MQNNNLGVDLTGKVAVVTGGGGDIGSEFAMALAKCNAKVALLDLTAKKAKILQENIQNCNKIARVYECNVLDKKQVESVAEQVERELGSCDILINCAGGNHPSATTDTEYLSAEDIGDIKTFFDLEEDGIRKVFDLNILGSILPTQAFSKQMLGKNGCCIVNISSMNAFCPLTKIPAYSAAKAGISNFTQWLAVHFSKVGIRVNALAPGFFSTTQNKALLWNGDGSPTPRTHKILSATPMGRLGECKELIGGLLYLVDAELSSFVTGIVLPIDGGFSAYSGV